MSWTEQQAMWGLVLLMIVLSLGGGLELGLRLILGLGNPLLYLADDQMGYRLAPNQQTRRFGNRIFINQYSMRSNPIAEQPAPDTRRILLLGDSVANGGWWTDQTNTISEMLSQDLRSIVEGQSVEILNASANSWGPRNELAYLQRFGSFGAQTVVVLINTDDLFAQAPSPWAVGHDRNYPNRKPALALVELLDRYRRASASESPPKPKEEGDRVSLNLDAIQMMCEITQQTNARFLLAMTPLLREIGHPGSRDYEIVVRQRLLNFTQVHQIPYLDFLPIFQSVSQPETLYRDHIHLSPEGNRLVSHSLGQAISQDRV